MSAPLREGGLIPIRGSYRKALKGVLLNEPDLCVQILWHIAYNTNVIYLQVLATKVILLFQILLIVQAVESGIVDLVCFLVQSREWWVLAFLSFGHCLRRHLVEFQVLCQHDRRPFQGSAV